MLLLLPPGNESSGPADLPPANRSEGAGGGGGSGSEAVVVPVVFGLIFVVGLVGNSLVMVVIGRMRCGGGGGGGAVGMRSGSPTNIFILNLSVADLSFLLLCVPFQATIYSLPQWVFGGFVCKVGHYFSSVCMLVSIFTLVAMSADRYVAVVHSKRSACVRSRRNALAAVCVIWTASLLCSVPVAQHQVLTRHPAAPNSTFCWEMWTGASRAGYRVTIVLVGYLLPLLLISCCYARVLYHLHKKMKNMSKKSECAKRKVQYSPPPLPHHHHHHPPPPLPHHHHPPPPLPHHHHHRPPPLPHHHHHHHPPPSLPHHHHHRPPPLPHHHHHHHHPPPPLPHHHHHHPPPLPHHHHHHPPPPLPPHHHHPPPPLPHHHHHPPALPHHHHHHPPPLLPAPVKLQQISHTQTNKQETSFDKSHSSA
uniref:G-protein coupled receptors family 1 profile domain-containing protein n=1 Tax=Scophthalmus maximus TaxID=52904 RepID=A0A8D2ZTH7_SCOMX